MSSPAVSSRPRPLRILVAGATGYIGRHVARELVARGHEVVAFARPRAGVGGTDDADRTRSRLAGAEVRFGDVTDVESVRRAGFGGERFDAVVSCLATRTGGIRDAWRIEHDAQSNLLAAAEEAGVRHFVLLSAICVQKPRLEFQRAKLAFEGRLERSGLDHSIVRPTAFFKSLAGQVEAVRRGRAFVMLGDGEATRTKPIAETDLARFMADCLEDPDKRNRILPIGGPGPALTPREQGALLFGAFGRRPRYRRVPVAVFDAIVGVLGAAARVVPRWADKAEYARIGRYYATESMLVWNEAAGCYDADATPSFGDETLERFYARVAREGLAGQELGDHAMF